MNVPWLIPWAITAQRPDVGEPFCRHGRRMGEPPVEWRRPSRPRSAWPAGGGTCGPRAAPPGEPAVVPPGCTAVTGVCRGRGSPRWAQGEPRGRAPHRAGPAPNPARAPGTGCRASGASHGSGVHVRCEPPPGYYKSSGESNRRVRACGARWALRCTAPARGGGCRRRGGYGGVCRHGAGPLVGGPRVCGVPACQATRDLGGCWRQYWRSSAAVEGPPPTSAQRPPGPARDQVSRTDRWLDRAPDGASRVQPDPPQRGGAARPHLRGYARLSARHAHHPSLEGHRPDARGRRPPGPAGGRRRPVDASCGPSCCLPTMALDDAPRGDDACAPRVQPPYSERGFLQALS